MEGKNQNIREEFLNLVHESCDFQVVPSTKFQDFHSTLLKFTFGAIDVKVNYEAQVILIWNSKPSSDEALRLRDYNNAMLERVSYSNLEETILGSLGEGDFQERFYRHLIYEYGHSNSNGDDVLSA